MRMPNATKYPLLAKPNIRLSGPVDQSMYHSFRQQLDACSQTSTLVVALTTLGGDPEVARTMADDIRLLEDHDDFCFSGRSRSIPPAQPSWRHSRSIAAS